MPDWREKVVCSARVQERWYYNGCLCAATQERYGRPLCSIHARQFDKWRSQHRALKMAVLWWEWPQEQSDD